MATLVELAREHLSLDPPAVDHLKRLVAAWGVLSDLSFADLLLYAPLLATGPGPPVMVLGQVRPSTSQTLYNEDLV
ncbi:MAG: histidine kinase N-terminal domain-containing protein, partial [Acidimicrobiales bacterium]